MAVITYANGRVRFVNDYRYVLRSYKAIKLIELTSLPSECYYKYEIRVHFNDGREYQSPWFSFNAFTRFLETPCLAECNLRIKVTDTEYKGPVWRYLEILKEKK